MNSDGLARESDDAFDQRDAAFFGCIQNNDLATFGNAEPVR